MPISKLYYLPSLCSLVFPLLLHAALPIFFPSSANVLRFRLGPNPDEGGDGRNDKSECATAMRPFGKLFWTLVKISYCILSAVSPVTRSELVRGFVSGALSARTHNVRLRCSNPPLNWAIAVLDIKSPA